MVQETHVEVGDSARLRVNSVVAGGHNGGLVNGRTNNGKLMKTEKKRKTKRSVGTRNYLYYECGKKMELLETKTL